MARIAVLLTACCSCCCGSATTAASATRSRFVAVAAAAAGAEEDSTFGAISVTNFRLIDKGRDEYNPQQEEIANDNIMHDDNTDDVQNTAVFQSSSTWE